MGGVVNTLSDAFFYCSSPNDILCTVSQRGNSFKKQLLSIYYEGYLRSLSHLIGLTSITWNWRLLLFLEERSIKMGLYKLTEQGSGPSSNTKLWDFGILVTLSSFIK